MPLNEKSELMTISTVLARDQVERVNARMRKRKQDAPGTRPTMADVYREVVEAGLAALPLAPVMISDTSNDQASSGVAA